LVYLVVVIANHWIIFYGKSMFGPFPSGRAFSPR